jgi:hypothetical protein
VVAPGSTLPSAGQKNQLNAKYGSIVAPTADFAVLRNDKSFPRVMAQEAEIIDPLSGLSVCRDLSELSIKQHACRFRQKLIGIWNLV